MYQVKPMLAGWMTRGGACAPASFNASRMSSPKVYPSERMIKCMTMTTSNKQARATTEKYIRKERKKRCLSPEAIVSWQAEVVSKTK